MTRSPEGPKRARSARVLRGLGAAPGIAIGRALVLARGNSQIFRKRLRASQVEAEVKRLEVAVDETRRQLQEIRSGLNESAGQQYAFIFEAHLLFLEDKRLIGDAIAAIRKESVNAEWALDQVRRRVERYFSKIADPYLRERAQDVRDVHDRVQKVLAGAEDHRDLSKLTEDVIIVTHALPPSEAAGLHCKHVVGIVTEVGGSASHTAIVAKSLEIPAAVGVENALDVIQPGHLIAVDGRAGQVVVSPNEAALKRYVRRQQAYNERELELIANRDLPARTTDGASICLQANIELLGELGSAIDHGAEGIGLYRSEFLFLQKSPKLPTEDEHLATYSGLIEGIGKKPVTIRTLDLGGEKYFHDVLGPGELNPVLGLRAIRFCLTRPDIIETQLRAVLRAAVHGEVRVMFPLISCMEELDEIDQLLARVKQQLTVDGREFRDDLPVGIMVEVPSAATMADRLAKRVDFFALGTNDLIQYTLAVDRGNEHVAHLFQPLHPAVLRLIHQTARAAHEARIGLSVCGEMAASPLHAPVLIGLGVTDLSMDPVSIPAVKEVIRATSLDELQDLAKECLGLDSSAEVERLVRRRIGSRLPGLPGER